MKYLSLILVVFLAEVFGAVQAQANTWGAPYQAYPHGGTGVNSHDFMSPSNLAAATVIANGHGYYNYNTQQSTSTSCIPQTVWTYFTFDQNFRPGSGVSFGYVHFWRQDC